MSKAKLSRGNRKARFGCQGAWDLEAAHASSRSSQRPPAAAVTPGCWGWNVLPLSSPLPAQLPLGLFGSSELPAQEAPGRGVAAEGKLCPLPAAGCCQHRCALLVARQSRCRVTGVPPRWLHFFFKIPWVPFGPGAVKGCRPWGLGV